jgi:oxygen-independent coproporphyrinogen-3 oxidase
MASMEQTLDKVIAANPDRIALYNYAHLPHIFKPQRRISEADMPTPAVKLDLLALCIRRLCDAGYIYIGMDHFAKPDDELAVAQRQGRCSATSRAIPRAPRRS